MKKGDIIEKILYTFIILMFIQLCLTVYQITRYDKHNYSCVEMSHDCEMFFESLGIHTLRAHSDDHVWLILDFKYFKLPFESTALMFFNPEWLGEKIRYIDEGDFIGSQQVGGFR